MSARGRYLPFDDEMLPGERIGPPLGGRRKLKGAILLAVACAVGWAMLGDPYYRRWLPADCLHNPARLLEHINAYLDRKAQPAPRFAAGPTNSIEPAARPPFVAPPPLAPLPTVSPPAAIPLAASAAPEPSAPLTTGALPSAAAPGAPGQPLPAPTVDPSNPYQVRAAAVGLHPDLSSVLLARLSDTDYRNAGYPIETAVKETSDSGVFVWPRQRKPELALFQVRFVAGAATGCRRYVVTIIKDRWSTTAMPMEKCKAEQVSSRRR